MVFSASDFLILAYVNERCPGSIFVRGTSLAGGILDVEPAQSGSSLDGN